jgi:transcriptional regulator with XRE-family HTH domain
LEFHQKLQELRRKKGLTQEELAASLYVSRTAISKWESGRGYPNIDSLRAIAKFFSVTVDELLSTDEVLEIAEEDQKQKETHFRDLAFGLLDLCVAMLFFLPFFAERGDGVRSVSLLFANGLQPWLKIFGFSIVIGMTALGILTLALQNYQGEFWSKRKHLLSLMISAVAGLLLIVSLQPYAAVFVLILLAIKTAILIKR